MRPDSTKPSTTAARPVFSWFPVADLRIAIAAPDLQLSLSGESSLKYDAR